MFVINLRAWRDERFVRETCSESLLDELDLDLESLLAVDRRGEIEWGMRQVVFEARD
jgi:hypothetical protein